MLAGGAGGHGLVFFPEGTVDGPAAGRRGGGPVAAVAGGAALVRGIRGSRGVLEPLSRLPGAIADEEVLEDLGAGARVVGGVPPELRGAEEPAPDADVDLHQADIARRRREVCDDLTAPDELAPAALLPGGRLYDVMEEVVEAFVERVRIQRTLGGYREEAIDGLAVDRQLFALGHPAVETAGQIAPLIGFRGVGGAGPEPAPARPGRLPSRPPRRRVGVAEAEELLQARVGKVGLLQGIACERRVEALGEPAQAVGREVEPGRGSGGVDGRQRVAGRQEDHVAKGSRGVALLLDHGLPDDAAEAVPGAEEDLSH